MTGGEIFHENGSRAALLVHGFTATTEEVAGLAGHLADQGFSVLAPVLAGHNASKQDIIGTEAADYYDSVKAAYDRLAGYDSIDIIGLSFGATLSLRLAMEEPVRRIVALSPAVRFKTVLGWVARPASLLTDTKQKSAVSVPGTDRASPYDLYDEEAVDQRKAYDFVPLRAFASVRRFVHDTRNRFDEITSPILIMQSRTDATVKPSGAEELKEAVRSSQRRLTFIGRSGHIITKDAASTVRGEAGAFLA